MKQIRIYLLSVLVGLSLLIAFLILTTKLTEEADAEFVAKAVSVQGVVEALRAGETEWKQVKLNESFYRGEAIRVRENSRAAIVLSNETFLRLNQNTQITFTGQRKELGPDLLKSTVHFLSRVVRSLNAMTSFVNTGVKG